MTNKMEINDKKKNIENDIDTIERKILRDLEFIIMKLRSQKECEFTPINETTLYRTFDKQLFTITPQFNYLKWREPETVFKYTETATYSNTYDEDRPYVSIIIPIYNAEIYLAKTLDSILIQTLRNIEIICVNDGSTDNSQKILEEYSKKDKRIKIIQKENGGQASARNKGIENAKGNFIAFIDSDDLIPKDYYEILYSNAIIYKADIVQCRYFMVYENEKEEPWPWNHEIMASESRNKYFKNRLMLAYSSGVVWNKIYSTKILKGIRFIDDSSPWEDNIFTIMALQKASNIVSVPDTYYFYIQRNNSSIHEPNSKVHFRLLKSYEYIIEYLNNKKNNIKTEDYKEFYPLLIGRMNYEYTRMCNNGKVSVIEHKKYDKMHHRLFFKIKYLPITDKLNCTTEYWVLKNHFKKFIAPFVILELIFRLIKNILLFPYYYIKDEVFNQ